LKILNENKMSTESTHKTVSFNATLSSTASETHHSAKVNIAQLNHARVLSVLGQSDQSIKEGLASNPQDVYGHVTLGFAYFRKRQFDQSVKSFEAALKVSTDDLTRSEILILLTMVNHKSKNLELSKKFIAQCNSSYPTSRQGWHVTCALAISIGDFNLAQNSLNQLRKLEGSQHDVDIYLLYSQFHLLQGNFQQAQNQLCKALHLFPTKLHLWNKLSEIILRNYSDTLILANISRVLGSPMCQKQPSQPPEYLLSSGRKYSDLLSNERTLIRLNHLTYSHLLFGKLSPSLPTKTSLLEAKSYVQSAIHSNPMDSKSFYLLALSTYAYAIYSKRFSDWKAAKRSVEIALSKHRNSGNADLQKHVDF